MEEEKFRKELLEYGKRYPEEEPVVQYFLKCLNLSDKNVFFRENNRFHITASAWMLDPARQYVFLIHHRKLNKLIQPGGHCERSDTSVRMAALREAREESGMNSIRVADEGIYYLGIHNIAANKTEREHLHLDVCYVFFADRQQPFSCSRESHTANWYKLDSLVKGGIEDGDLQRMIKRECVVLQ